MNVLLSAIGRAFLRAFISSLVIFGIGFLAAPQLDKLYLVGVSALLGAFASGLRAIQVYIPQLSFVKYLGHPYGDLLDSFLRAFLATLVVTLPPVLDSPDLSTVKSLLVGVFVGALAAGLRAVQGLLTIGELPLAAKGLPNPNVDPAPTKS